MDKIDGARGRQVSGSAGVPPATFRRAGETPALPPPVVLFDRDECEPRHTFTRITDGDGFAEHRRGPYPPSQFAMERLIDHQWLERLGVPRNAEHAILAALVVAIPAGTWLGGQGRKRRAGFHGSTVEGARTNRHPGASVARNSRCFAVSHAHAGVGLSCVRRQPCAACAPAS